MKVAITGAQAVAHAMRQINPDVVAVFPITPQTEIMMQFAEFHADGEVDTELIRVESEHSAMSCTVGASAAGARAMTATSSAGLALMWEIVGVASGSRLPIVMPVVNRAISAPINIHCDHSDAMGARDLGWVQIFCEYAKEAYEITLMAVKIAEKLMLPVMVCQDGFISSHGTQNVELLQDQQVKDFVGEYKPNKYLLNTDDPVTMGPLQLQDYFFETQKQRADAMGDAQRVYLEVGNELSKITGNDYGVLECYHCDDAEAVIVVMSSTAGNAKAVVTKMREQGKKVGVIKLRLFRPFPYKDMSNILKDKKYVAVLDRSESFGANPPIFGEVKSSLYEMAQKPKIKSYVFGLGGRNIYESDIEEVYNQLLSGEFNSLEQGYIGVR